MRASDAPFQDAYTEWHDHMASKAAAAEAETETPAEGADGPLLDMSDAAVKKMIKAAKSRGFVT